MRYSEQFMEHIEYAFHAFCKIVLRHEAINTWRDLKRKEAREISLDYLMSERYFEPSDMDSYFEKQDKPTVFIVLGKEVIVDDKGNGIIKIAGVKAGSFVALLLRWLS